MEVDTSHNYHNINMPRGIIHMDAKHYYEIHYFPGMGTNMKDEFSTLWALMFLVNSKRDKKKLQIMGNLKVVT